MLLVAAFLLPGPAGVAAPDGATTALRDDVTVVVEPASTQLVLGDSLDLTVEATNAGGAATEPLVIHLDVTDVAAPGSVDPEDWTSTLTEPVGSLAPGASRTLRWTVQPISAGTFSLYAVTLPARAGAPASPATSDVSVIEVTTRQSLNPRGILPVSIAVPGLVGLLLALTLRRRRGPPGTASVDTGPGVGDR